MSKAVFRVAAFVVSTELIWVALSAPALLFPSPLRSLALLIPPAIWICAGQAEAHFIPRTALDGTILALLVMVLVSLYATFDITFSLSKLAGLVLGIAVFYALVRSLRSERRVWLLTGGVLLITAGFAAAALAGTDWADKYSWIGRVTSLLPIRLRGLPGAEEGFQPNVVGGTLVLVIPLQISLLLSSYKRGGLNPSWSSAARRLIIGAQLALLAMTATTLLLAQSRGAWLSLSIALFCWMGWHNERSRRLALYTLLIGTAGLAAGLLILGPAALFRGVFEVLGTGAGTTLASRWELWRQGLAGIQDFPLTGMGFNNFRVVMPVLYPEPSLPQDVDVAHAHNHLLQAALDLGLPGLAAYLGLWLAAATALFTSHRRAASVPHQALSEGLAAGLIAYFVFGMTDVIPLGAKVGLLFWIVLALLAGQNRLLQSGTAPCIRATLDRRRKSGDLAKA